MQNVLCSSYEQICLYQTVFFDKDCDRKILLEIWVPILLTLFTMWVLIINTKFDTAEPRHFEMQKYPHTKDG